MTDYNEVSDQHIENLQNIEKWGDYFQSLLTSNGYENKGITRPVLELLLEEDSGQNPQDIELYLDLVFKDDDYVFTHHFEELTLRVFLADYRQTLKNNN